MREIKSMGLGSITSVRPFEKCGLRPKKLLSEDYLRSVKDMFEFIEGGKIVAANLQKKNQTGQGQMLTSYTSDSLHLL